MTRPSRLLTLCEGSIPGEDLGSKRPAGSRRGDPMREVTGTQGMSRELKGCRSRRLSVHRSEIIADRTALAWQNTAYNQPPHPSFFIGDGMATAPRPTVYTP